jgi:hypothetical protein
MTERRSPAMSRFEAAKIDIFNDELGALVQKYLDMKDVDPLALYGPLWRRAEEMKFIGCEERRQAKSRGGGNP